MQMAVRAVCSIGFGRIVRQHSINLCTCVCVQKQSIVPIWLLPVQQSSPYIASNAFHSIWPWSNQTRAEQARPDSNRSAQTLTWSELCFAFPFTPDPPLLTLTSIWITSIFNVTLFERQRKDSPCSIRSHCVFSGYFGCKAKAPKQAIKTNGQHRNVRIPTISICYFV